MGFGAFNCQPFTALYCFRLLQFTLVFGFWSISIVLSRMCRRRWSNCTKAQSLLCNRLSIQALFDKCSRRPSLVFIQLGDNDFALGTSLEELATKLLALASLLRGRYAVTAFVIGALLPLFPSSLPSRHAMFAERAGDNREWANNVYAILQLEIADLSYVKSFSLYQFNYYVLLRMVLFKETVINRN